MTSVSPPTLHEYQVQEPRPQLRVGSVRLHILALLLGPLLLGLLKAASTLDLEYRSPLIHFWTVTSAALLAIGLAILMLRVGVVRRDGRVLLISSGFLALSSIFLVHAISTPEVLFANAIHATAWSTPIALAVGAVILSLSTIDRFAQQGWIVRRWRWWVAAGSIVWLLYTGFMLVYVPMQAVAIQQSTAAPAQTLPESISLQAKLMALMPTVTPLLYGAVICLYGVTAWMYWQRLRQTPTRPLRALTTGSILLAETALAAHYGTLWHLSFWLYHVLLVAAILTIGYGVLLSYEQSGSLSSSVEGLLLGTTLQRQREGFQGGMAALLATLEQGNLAQLPLLRGELRQRFALADDQLDLLEHAVQVVAQEREEQRRIRVLADVSRAAILDLDPDSLLHNAVTSFVQATETAVCAVGLLANGAITFAPHHCHSDYQPLSEPLIIVDTLLSSTLFTQDEALVMGALAPEFAPLGVGSRSALLLPLRHGKQGLGIMVVQPRSSAPIDERLITVCRSITAHLATALANARLHQALQQQHEHLLRSEQAREQLTQMVIHDLKNPLTSIKGYHTLLQMTNLTADQLELVQGAQRSTNTMAQLVNDMLDLARLEEGRLELRRTGIDIGTLFRECRNELHLWAEQGSKQIEIAIDDDLPQINVDAGLMRRVLLNLLSNAVKHTPNGTVITLRADVSDDAAHIFVQDTGHGIPLSRQQTLFDRFSTGAAEGQHQRNTGLGLAFCKLAVEAHSGTISVQSAPPHGTTFIISLPTQVIALAEA